MIKIAIYVRVSTIDQKNENQLVKLRDYCRNNNFKIVKEYVENGISGTKTSRPELDKMLQAMRKREFDAIVVWKFDRLGRSTIHLLQVLEEMQKLGVGLIATSQNIDTSTPHGKLFFTMLSGFAEFEREVIRERIMLGLERTKKQGTKLGRPFGAIDKKRRVKSGYFLRWASVKV
jgi:DNA invertase Pin-like site-specific DNA recombinase